MRWVLFTGFHAVSTVKYSEIYSFVASSRCGVTLKHKHFFLEQKKKKNKLFVLLSAFSCNQIRNSHPSQY